MKKIIIILVLFVFPFVLTAQPVRKTTLLGNRNEKVINTEKLSSGTYLISLMVNGKIIETKKLNLLK